MRILFVSNNFPPEVNAPAVRLHEHARHWVNDGHDVEVLTSAPHFPEGQVYEGYRNRLAYDEVDGIDVVRVPMYVTANEGTVRRIISYLSFMLSAVLFSGRVRRRPDIIVATSPQFFAGIAGYMISRLKRKPFVLEVRDLWPESIVAVGAMKRNIIIRLLERVERFLYNHADRIVVVTNAFRDFIGGKGIDVEKITVLKNGADLDAFAEPLDEALLADLRARYALDGRFVVSYIGTIGMAHRADVLLEAARRCPDPEVVFMVVGAGAEREALAARQDQLRLPNFRLIDKQPRHVARHLLGLSDVSVVHLQASPLFRTVIPSKIFEAMAMAKPIILGVEGESLELIEEAGAGLPVRPEDAADLLQAVLRLREDTTSYEQMAERGYRYVHRRHDRRRLAREYVALLEEVRLGKELSLRVSGSGA